MQILETQVPNHYMKEWDLENSIKKRVKIGSFERGMHNMELKL